MADRPQLAAIVTTYHRHAHAQHIVDRFLEGYGWNGQHHRPAMDVVSILQKKKLDIKGFRVLMDGKRAEEHPKRFTEMNFVYEVKGDIPKTAVDEAIKLSKEKYCSVSATIQQGVQMNIESKVVS